MLKSERDYVAKVPGDPGHLCRRCAMTRESRARFVNNCPFADTPAEDVCPHYDPQRSTRPKQSTTTKGNAP